LVAVMGRGRKEKEPMDETMKGTEARYLGFSAERGEYVGFL